MTSTERHKLLTIRCQLCCCIFSTLCCCFLLASCGASRKMAAKKTVVTSNEHVPATTFKTLAEPLDINSSELIAYANKYLGAPYKYGGTTPRGFDCSGFVYYVLMHFGVKPPRVTYQYEHVGKTIKVKHALPGDIILFTGTSGKKIGHMGIITKVKQGTITFIHASSPRSGGVIISSLEGYWEEHFVKIVRILQ